MIDHEYGPKTRNAALGEIRNLHTPQTDFILNRMPLTQDHDQALWYESTNIPQDKVSTYGHWLGSQIACESQQTR